MLMFILRRLGVMILTMVCLTMVVFYLVNLEPNLRKLAISQTNMRASDEAIENWLVSRGYRDNFFERYAEWLGVWPRDPLVDPDTGEGLTLSPRCTAPEERGYYGVLQGYLGCSTKFRIDVFDALVGLPDEREIQRFERAQERLADAQETAATACAGSDAEGCSRAETALARAEQALSSATPPRGPLAATGVLMFWVMVTMVPAALIIGVLAGMREGSGTDRSLSVVSITSTSTPEYVSGVVFAVIFASWLGWLNGSAGTATREVTFVNFALPVMTMAVYGMGYIARMTRASMAEVMTAQYIRTARLKGLSFPTVVLRHALRNALIAPFTVIMLQFPWLLTGVVIVETMFSYKGFGWLLVEAAGNNDVDLLLAASIVSVAVVLTTQLISDIGYVYLNPRIRVQ